MMPRAKMVMRRMLPPENKSTKPSSDPLLCSMYCWKSAVLTPGIGMCPPMRYTASRPSVKKTRLRRSGMRKILANLSNITSRPQIGHYFKTSNQALLKNLKLAAGLGDLFLRRLRKLVRLHGDGRLQLAIAQNLYRLLGADHTRLAQHIGIDRVAQPFQFFQVHDVEFLAEDVGEAALRHTPVQRHLAALKSAHHARTAAGALPFMSAG